MSPLTEWCSENMRISWSEGLERLALVHALHTWSSKEHDEVGRTEWRRHLQPFKNIEALGIEDVLVEKLSRFLQLEDGELPLELLPDLQELTYSGSGDTGPVIHLLHSSMLAGTQVVP
jgi:hypothetical protein